MEPIVIATGNPHKVEEMRAIFARQRIAVVGLKDLGGSFSEPSETGATFEENATIKALSYAAQTGRVCLADDSGLEVDALGGAPGVISSHYSSDGRETGLSREERDAANNLRLLRELEGVPEGRRGARFVCVMCLAGPPRSVETSGSEQPQSSEESQSLGGAQGLGEGKSLGGAGFQPAPSSGEKEGGAGYKPAPPKLPFTPSKPLSAFQSFDGTFHKAEGGNLPHWQVAKATHFVTFRVLHGTLSEEERAIVCDACLHWHGTRLILHLAVAMPDHVHLIFRPLQQDDGSWPTLKGIMHSMKRHSAGQIQRLRGKPGALWQSEYYDRIIRSYADFEEKMSYVAMNPVRAGLANKPGHYAYAVRGERIGSGLQTRSPQASETSGLTGVEGSSRVLALCRGTFEGRIGMRGDVPRGENGFGYDPLFLLPPPDIRSGAELPAEEKNRLSHRAAAAGMMAQKIAALF